MAGTRGKRGGQGKLSHFDRGGAAHMVDVGAKPETMRVAIASGSVRMRAATAALVRAGRAGKGDVLGLARVAAIQGLKRTAELIPLCHPVRVVGVEVALEVSPPRARQQRVTIRAEVHALDRTGVEMEALTAVSIAALTVYDMLKAVDRGMVIEAVRLDEKRGGQGQGKSGLWQRT